MPSIIPAATPADYGHIRELMAEYMAWDCARSAELGLDVIELVRFCYHGGKEPLPGAFVPPQGRLLLAMQGEAAAGCGAFRPLAPGICEMKRFYVRPAFRGLKIGRGLAEALVAQAREAGYAAMRLETVTFMREALALYRDLGFRERDPYSAVPPGFAQVTVFMEKDLTAGSRSRA